MRAVIFLIILFLLCAIHRSEGQPPDWAWVKSSGGTKINNTVDAYGNEAYTITADPYGNVIAAGYFVSDKIIFDNDTLYNDSSGANDIFIVKYDNNGNVLWARSAGGAGNDCPNTVTTDQNGNVIVAGFYKSSWILFGNDTLVNSGYTDLFVLKFDPNGDPLWARSATGTAEDIAMSVSADDAGNIYMTGYSQSPTIIFGTDTLTTHGSSDVIIVKYSAGGNVIRANVYGNTMEDRGNAVAADASGNVYVGGAFKDSYIIFGLDTLFNNSANGYSDMFLTKFDSTGNIIWTRSAGAVSDERLYSIAINNSGDIYATGVFFSSTFSLGSTTLTNSFINRADIFISKWNSSGQLLWCKGAGGTKDDQSLSVATDASGNLALAICYNSPSIIISQDTLHDSGLYDGALAFYDPNGNLQWTKNIGGSRDESAYAVAINSLGNIFVAGYYQSPTVVFDTIILASQDTAYSTAYVGSIENIITDVVNIENIQPLYVYPNPCDGVFTAVSGYHNDAVLSVYNITGARIFSVEHPSFMERIDLTGISKGVYLVRLESSEGAGIVKLLVE